MLGCAWVQLFLYGTQFYLNCCLNFNDFHFHLSFALGRHPFEGSNKRWDEMLGIGFAKETSTWIKVEKKGTDLDTCFQIHFVVLVAWYEFSFLTQIDSKSKTTKVLKQRLFFFVVYLNT